VAQFEVNSGLLIQLKGHFGPPPNYRAMNQPDKSVPGKEAPKPEPSRSEEAMRIIEAYAAALREIIKKLRSKLH
jgi:hypothetical protein